jgi:glycosyltransferase involved in cell wall biosynthesis
MQTVILMSSPVPEDAKGRIEEGRIPHHDFLLLAERLGARLVSPTTASWGKLGRASRAWRLFRVAYEGFRQRKSYDLVISDQDLVGFFLALLFKVSRTKKRHIVICHGKLAQPHIGRFVRLTRVHKQIDRFVCYGTAVAERMVQGVKVPQKQVVVIRHPVDHTFWRPGPVAPQPKLIASAGMYSRDYRTLAEAVRGLDVRLEVAAYSPWVDPKANVEKFDVPSNVHFTRLSQEQLRGLYARALFVAVPLMPNDIQVGSLVLYEAMAMGKAILVTRTAGQEGLGVVREGENGFFVPPGDVQAWRRLITYLLDRPEEAIRMGERSRAIVEGGLNLFRYVDEMAKLARSLDGSPSQTSSPGPDRAEDYSYT